MLPALGACYFAMDAARSLNSVQAAKTETVQTRQLLWIRVQVKMGRNIHVQEKK